ncbi:MAG: ribonuclease D [Ardenticatenia bacterium]|nr:ribonuclease D [Ardenticatenia bacterium]
MKPRRPTVHIADLPVIHVETRAHLEQVAHHLRRTTRLAFDTEFLRETQYRPQLELIQLATDDLLVIVDYRAVPTLEPLLDVLLDPSTLKVVHAARQDLETIYHLTRRVPTPLFDTQVAAALVGLGAQAGYATLVEHLLGIQLPKSQTLTNWAHRPLTEAQVAYALDDVRYLLPLHDELGRRLEVTGRSTWFAEEMERLASPSLYAPVAPEEAWRQVRGASALSPKELAILQAVAAWRERVAREHNRALPLILRDSALIAIAKQRPRSKQALRRLRGIHRWTLTHFSDELLDIIREASHTPRDHRPQRAACGYPPLNEDEMALLALLRTWVRLRAEEMHVAPTALADEHDLRELLRAHRQGTHDSLPLLRGWRREAVGDELIAILKGRAALRWDDYQRRFTLEPS